MGFGILVEVDTRPIIRFDELKTRDRFYGCRIKKLMIKAILRILDGISKFWGSLQEVRAAMTHLDQEHCGL
jgi:hypothetical protein